MKRQKKGVSSVQSGMIRAVRDTMGQVKCVLKSKSQNLHAPIALITKEGVWPPAGMDWKKTAQENMFNAIAAMLTIIPKKMKNVQGIRVQVNGMKHIDIVGTTRRWKKYFFKL